MSLIYQALRRLGSERRETYPGSESTWQNRGSSRQVSRSAFLWWLLAGVLTSSILTALLLQDREGPVPAESVAVAANEVLPAALVAAPVAIPVPAPDRVAAPERRPAVLPSPLLLAEPRRGASVVPTADPSASPPDDSASAPAPEPPVAPMPAQAAPAVVATSAGVSGERDRPRQDPLPAPGPATTTTTAPATPGPHPEERRRVQARTRAKNTRVMRLTAELTQAAQAGDEAALARLLAAIAEETGADSNYYLNLLAFVALARGDYGAVETALEVVLARDPLDANAGLNMAVVEARTGRGREAARRLERLAVAHPDDKRIGLLLRDVLAGR